MATRTTRTHTPALTARAFIQEFGTRAWADAQENEICAEQEPYRAVERYWPGFDVAFGMAFGRAATPAEHDLLQLYWYDLEHVHLSLRGRDANGFSYYADQPEREHVALRQRVINRHGLRPFPAPEAVQGPNWRTL